MITKGKTRIYDLAKSLVSENLSDKDRKNLQTKKTKQILEICEKLGYTDKTPSSSLENDLVAKVLVYLNQNEKTDLNAHKINSASEAPKKSRVLRRLEPQTPLPPQTTNMPEVVIIEEPQIEEIIEEEKAPMVQTLPEEEKEEEKKEKDIKKTLISEPPKPKPEIILKSNNIIAKPDIVIKSAKPEIKLPIQTPAANQDTQPFRVAKPINSSFNARRKNQPQASKQSSGRRGAQVNKSNLIKNKTPIEDNKPKELNIEHSVTVKELAELLKVQEAEVIRNLFLKGIMRTLNQTLETDLAIQVALDLGCDLTITQPKSDQAEDLAFRLKELVDIHTAEEKADLVYRPPVVTIMGHVDHGKTTLLDSIRKAKLQITSQESGGITQHIGAYQINVVDYDGKTRKVTFLDTPGHEAFTALRARGAQVTDIAILVVAADDGVMPQTIEAISHAKAAGVPIIIAVNKIDKPDANPDRILTQLVEHELVVEDYGGNIVCAKISAKQNINLDDLLTKITLVADAELGDKLLSNPSSRAVGAVIEAALSPNRGPVATLLIQSGTLNKGDAIAVGGSFGRVRAIFNDIGQEINTAPPSTPVQILGLDTLPQAGDTFSVFKSVQEAKASSSDARDKITEQKRTRGLEFFSSQVREGQAKELAVIVKADVQGSAEAITNEINKLNSDEVRIRIIHSAAGAVTENDINLASATNAIVVNFNSIIDGTALRLAQEQTVAIYNYNIIYEITDALRRAISGLLEPEKIEVKHGQAEIRQVFPAGKNKIAGCYVTEGKLIRGSIAKIIRNKKEFASLRLNSLKRFKDDVKEVVEGFECGVLFDGFNEFQESDIIECWGVEIQERKV